MSKNILILGAVIIIVVCLFAFFRQKTTTVTPPTTTTTVTIVTSGETTIDETYLLDDIVLDLTDEELVNINGELTSFNTGIENDISSDLSQFYYD
jgi:hypothetical protein